MNRDEILTAASMPAFGPSYPKGPYRFINREYMIISYESDPDAIRAAVPEPLVPASNVITYEWMRMPDSSGFGDYTETGTVIPCLLDGQPVSFTVQMYLDDEAPIAAGREIWGFPKKHAQPKLELVTDTLTGTLYYANERVALGTMVYKQQTLDETTALRALGKDQVCLKLIPDVDGKPKIAQLVKFAMTDIAFKGAWQGPARLHLIPHVNAPVADLPVLRTRGGIHLLADMTLPYGKVVHDYLEI